MAAWTVLLWQSWPVANLICLPATNCWVGKLAVVGVPYQLIIIVAMQPWQRGMHVHVIYLLSQQTIARSCVLQLAHGLPWLLWISTTSGKSEGPLLLRKSNKRPSLLWHLNQVFFKASGTYLWRVSLYAKHCSSKIRWWSWPKTAQRLWSQLWLWTKHW